MKKVASAILISIITTWAFVTLAQAEISREETYCLAQNMFFEARSESLEGQLMVAEVTINRANHKKFPNSICDVVWQRKQFSWTHDGKHDNPERMGKTDRLEWEKIKHLASLVLNEANHILPRTGALYYHATYVKPVWRHKLTYIKQVGAHKFYK